MTKQETMAIMAILREAYPIYYRDKTKDEIITSVNLWAEMFADDDVNIVKASIKAFIASDTKGFPPVIGQIKHQIQKLITTEEMTEVHAWDLVSKAIRNGTYGSEEEFEKLPTVIQKAIGSPDRLREWSGVEPSEVQTVVASNFMRSYRAKLAHEQEHDRLPNDVKQIMAQLQQKQRLELSDGRRS